MKKVKIIFYILIICTGISHSNIFANPIDYIKGRVSIGKANSLLKKGDYDSALKEYEKAKQSLKESDILYYNIANTFLKKGDHFGSTVAYEYAKEYINDKTSDKLKSDIYYNSGINNIEMEKYAEAIEDLKKSLTINPKDSDSISALEYARKRLKEQQGQQGGAPEQDEQDNNSNSQNSNSQENNNNKNNESGAEKKEHNKDGISEDEARRILDALRNDRNDTEKTKQNYRGGKSTENDW